MTPERHFYIITAGWAAQLTEYDKIHGEWERAITDATCMDSCYRPIDSFYHTQDVYLAKAEQT